MAPTESNPLLSSHKSADGFQILLHPLVLLTISDYITRHTLRRQEGSVAGALLGQQNGREISLEHAFECILAQNEQGEVVINQMKFEERLQQYKDVHKAPALDFVGWFTVAPISGPQTVHLPVHRQFTQAYNESAVFLAFHPETVAKSGASAGKLPLTVYESIWEGEMAEGIKDQQQAMETDTAVSHQNLRFRELPYTIDTGEAEMIGVDFVARGAGTAANAETMPDLQASLQDGKNVQDKGRAADQPLHNGVKTDGEGEAVPLSPEDEELIASLTTRANAIRMLHSRICLLKAYLSNLPPSYLTGNDTTPSNPSAQTQLNYPLLRSIQAVVGRLSLLIPADKAAFEREQLAEKNDVSLVTLMGSLTKSAKDVADAGKRFHAMETQRQTQSKQRPNQMQMPSLQMGESYAVEQYPGGML